MKKITKSFLAVVLSLMLMAMLPISAMADAVQATISYNAEYFIQYGDRSSRELPTNLYNGETIKDLGYSFSIEGAYDSAEEGVKQTYNFTFGSDAMEKHENDVLEITTDEETVELSGENPIKYIGIIANTSEASDTSADITLNFKNSTATPIVFEGVTINSMFKESACSKELSEALKTNSTGSYKKYDALGEMLYFNLIELKTDTLSEVASITFGKASKAYHIIGIVEIPYTPEEVESMKADALTQLLPTYKAKTLLDIEESDMDNLKLLCEALDPSHEDYNHVYNLCVGYPLYTAQKAVRDEYDLIMTKDYLTVTKEYLYENQDEVSNLDALLEVYEDQTAIEDKKEELQIILDFFGITENIFVDIAEKEIISSLKADYLLYKSHKELSAEIADRFDDYDEKQMSDITMDDIPGLDELIEAYNKADEIGLSYSAEDRKFIEKLRNYYVNAQNAEKNYHYDLTDYFNRGIIASIGENVPSDWGSNSTIKVNGSSYRTGILASKWNNSAPNGIVKATQYINYRTSDGVAHNPVLPYDASIKDHNITFKVSTATKATDKNAVILTSGTNAVTIQGSGRMSQTLDLLTVGGENNGIPGFNITINYADGSTQNQIINVAWHGYNAESVSPGLGSGHLYNFNGVATSQGSNKFLFRAYSIPLQEGKIIDSIVIKGRAQLNSILLGLSEQVVSNETFKTYLIKQYNIVKDYDEATFNAKEAAIFTLYSKEAENRGIELSTVKDSSGNPAFDMEIAEEIIKKVLTANVSFEKIDKDKVRATINFTQPVNESDLLANLKLQKLTAGKYEAIKDYGFEMIDDKTAVIEFADKFFGGVEYKLEILGDLPLKEYPTYKISNSYEFTYVSPAYLPFDANGFFERTSKDTFKATIRFTQPVDTTNIKEYISVLKSDKEFLDYKVEAISNKTVELTASDDPNGGAKYKIYVSENLKLKEYPEYNIPKTYEFVYDSVKYLEAKLDGSTLTLKNNTSTPYSYVVVMTEVSSDNTQVYSNIQIYDEVSKSSTNTHKLQINGKGNLFVSIWGENQKFLVDVTGGISATLSPTDETADYMKPTLDEKNVLKIAGFTPSKEKDKNITLDILKNGSSFMKKQVLTNKDGYFEIIVPLNDNLITSGSMLSFTLGGDDFNNKVSLEKVYYATKQQKKNAIDAIINPLSTADDIKTLLTSDEIYNINILALDADVYKNIDLEKASKLIFDKKALFSTENDKTLENSIKLLRQLLVVSAFNQDKKDVISKDGYLLYEDLMGYTSIDTSNVTIYNLYKTAVSEEGRSKLVDFLLAQEEYQNADAIISKMVEKMFLLELEYPAQSGVGYVSNVLTTPNTAKVGLSIPNYFAFSDKSGINEEIAKATIATKADLTSVVNTYYTDNYNAGGSDSGSLGGGFSSGSSSVTSFGADQPYLDSLANQNSTANSTTVFKDVSKDHWAYNYILELYDKNILSGKGNDMFAPEDGLTRAELVKIIVSAKNLKPNGASIPFADVSADSWYFPYVQTAYSNGIISGVTETSFAPNEKVSRQDLCVVLYRLLVDKSAGEINFNDSSNIAPYAQDAVKCFVNMGIINGFEDGSFRPADGCTRAQCAKIISMFLQK